jgi:glycogen operon protein
MQRDLASNPRPASTLWRNDVSKPSPGRGTSFPLGATVRPGGVHFSVFSKNATLVELLLFNSEDAIKPGQVTSLNLSADK